MIYLIIAIVGVLRFARKTRQSSVEDNEAPLTVLKPVCGLEPGLMENLCSFCDQDYLTYQVIFGVQNPKDPAISLIENIIAKRIDDDIGTPPVSDGKDLIAQ